ncbi:hypothetical protein ACI798_19845 [Geodermatophilus sp. SYSU D01045]
MNPRDGVVLAGKAVRALRAEGPAGLTERAVRTATRRLALGADLGMHPDDVVDSARVVLPPPGPVRPRGTALEVGWVITPPGPTSGGHTTLLRFVEALERAGHRCVLYLYDVGGGPVERHEAMIRARWPRVRAEVRSVADGLPAMDAYVASSWDTAHVLARHGRGTGHRFYLVQDFEPYFYPRGSLYELAEDTYRFGFQVVTVGHMVADELRERFGISPTVAEFGCDTAVYGARDDGPRDGVVLYCRPTTPRRGYELAVLALERFHRLRPEVPIHTFGARVRRLPFPADVHAHRTPAQLNELYQRCAAGLALSFTNISLIAVELLAAGVLPVVNDWRGSRADLDNPFVEWARPTPDGIADGLCRAVDRRAALSTQDVAASVAGLSWDRSERTVVDVIEQVCAGERQLTRETGR